MKHTFALKPCPWCRKTPQLYMLFQFGPTPEETWLPEIRCVNFSCNVKPKTKYVPIRKAQKKDPKIIEEKLKKLVSYWNDGNPLNANEGFQIDFDEIATCHN
jgi:hypothetical protein